MLNSTGRQTVDVHLDDGDRLSTLMFCNLPREGDFVHWRGVTYRTLRVVHVLSDCGTMPKPTKMVVRVVGTDAEERGR